MLAIAHRGARAEAPENTLAAFRRAVELGADGVELDLHRSRDGRLVVIHDDTLERTTNGRGPVASFTFDELRRLDAGSWMDARFAGERIPSLEEVLEAMPARVLIFAEMKAAAVVDPLARLLRERELATRVRVSSFDHRSLASVHRLVPEAELGALFVALPVDPVALARACGARALHPSFHYLTADVVAEAHGAGLAVYTWTVNEPDDIRRVRAIGVDGIFSDRPERLARA